MTEEYRVPDGMVGLSECGSAVIRDARYPPPVSGTVSQEPPAAQEPLV